jgi:hypothetical protein
MLVHGMTHCKNRSIRKQLIDTDTNNSSSDSHIFRRQKVVSTRGPSDLKGAYTEVSVGTSK